MSGVPISLLLCRRDCPVRVGVGVEFLLSFDSFESFDGNRSSTIDDRLEPGRDEDAEARIGTRTELQ